MLSRLIDFVTCSARFNIWSEGSIAQFLISVGRENLVDLYILIIHSYTQIIKSVMLVSCRKIFFIFGLGSIYLDWDLYLKHIYYHSISEIYIFGLGSKSEIWNIVGR